MAVHITHTWEWGNPQIPGVTSHYMRLQFDIDAGIIGSTVHVNITNIQMDGWNGTPDVGNTQDCIAIATNDTNLPGLTPAPPRPWALPYPGDLPSRGVFAEMSTFLNNGSPVRNFWNNGTNFSYTVPYVGGGTNFVLSIKSTVAISI